MKKFSKEVLVNEKAKNAILMADALAKLNAAITAYNEAVSKETVDPKALQKASEDLNDSLSEYKTLVKKERIYALLMTENPALSAAQEAVYMTVNVVDDRPDGVKRSDMPIAPKKLVDVSTRYDLIDLHKSIVGGIGYDPNWAFMVEKWSYLMALRVASDIGVSADELNRIKASYDISDAAAGLDMGKTPMSNTNLLKTLQKVITAIVGDGYKATSHDIRFACEAFAKHGKDVGTLQVSKVKGCRAIFLDILHHIVTGDEYAITGYKTKKK